MRVGHGYDMHRLASGEDLVIGGVNIEHSQGLIGHSDADVLVHAMMDALLGALALGDIGQSFPPFDEQYRGISSLILLKKTKKILDDIGYTVINIDSTIVAERPKLAPYILTMRSNIATVLGVELNCVSIKATTTEGLGPCGREEGIAAHAVALLEHNNA